MESHIHNMDIYLFLSIHIHYIRPQFTMHGIWIMYYSLYLDWDTVRSEPQKIQVQVRIVICNKIYLIVIVLMIIILLFIFIWNLNLELFLELQEKDYRLPSLSTELSSITFLLLTPHRSMDLTFQSSLKKNIILFNVECRN